MTTAKIEYDSAIGGDFSVPENIQTFKYASEHIFEIKQLSEAIAHPSSTKLVFQKLPKHMRRRAMSHNPKRLPRKYRQAHQSQMSKSGVPAKTKRPSRKYRRKPDNLLNEYRRRQQKNIWLETHIWHAKRFHMVDKWGYKLAQSSCDKTFRSSFRASANHCLLQDISYIGCIEMKGPVDVLKKGFDRMKGPTLGLGICAKAYLNGLRQGTVDLFKPDTYPFGALGRVSFIWKQEMSDVSMKKLWIFVHPSIYKSIVEELRKLFELEETKAQPVDGENNNSVSHLATPKSYKNTSTEVKMVELKDCLNRFRLTGPLSQSVLSAAFKCKPPEINDGSWFREFTLDSTVAIHRSQSEYWLQVKDVRSPAELPPNAVLALNIEDPRINRPKKRTKSLPSSGIYTEEVNMATYNIPEYNAVSKIWHSSIRNRISSDKMTTHELCSLRNKHVLVPGERCAFESNLQPIPVLLIQRPGISSSERPGYGCGWDIILPAGYGISTWMCLVMWGAKPGALRETETMLREGLEEEFLPDTLTAKLNDELVEKECREKYFRRPPNRRRNYKKLSIASPFRCPWPQLVSEWSKTTSDKTFYVLRDKPVLEQLHQCLEHRQKPSTLNISDNCLIPISITMDSRGSVENFSVVCLPKKSDLKRDLRMKQSLISQPIYTEPVRADNQELARKELRRKHLRLLKRLRRRRVRTKRRQQETAQRKVLIVKASTAALVAEQRKTIGEMWLPSSPTNIRHQSTREVFGYLTQAHFSFIKAKVGGIGYATVNGIRSLLKITPKTGPVKVLVRDPNSNNYHKGTLKIRL